MLPRSLSAACQSFSSKPRLAPLPVFLAFAFGFTRPAIYIRLLFAPRGSRNTPTLSYCGGETSDIIPQSGWVKKWIAPQDVTRRLVSGHAWDWREAQVIALLKLAGRYMSLFRIGLLKSCQLCLSATFHLPMKCNLGRAAQRELLLSGECNRVL